MNASEGPTVEQLRAIGLPMGSWYERWYVCWTTDANKALAAEELGARVRPYTSQDPKFNGWEIISPRQTSDGDQDD